MFLWPNLPAALDRLKAAGGNYVRCLVSGWLRETMLWPFARKGDRYDLDQWNEEYWRLFETFLQETEARDIVTDIELWATFDYYREPWARNPFNPKNNVNYTAEQTGLPSSWWELTALGPVSAALAVRHAPRCVPAFFGSPSNARLMLFTGTPRA